MSTNIPVKIAYFCSRKQKTIDIEVPLETAHVMAERHAAKANSGAKLATALEQLKENEDEPLPDFLCVFRGKIIVLSNVHPTNDDSMKRALNMAIGSDVFEVPPPKPRKKGDTTEEASAE